MSEGDSVGDSVHGKPSVVYRFFTRLGQIYQSWLDKSTPYTAVRWVVTLGLSFVYMIRVYLLQGWYIVTYALGIYHLNLFIAFLSPKVDPSLMEDSDDGPSLPTKQNEEFRPFIRRLPEFKFWHAATKGILVAMACTFFEAFNVPVFWPILVMYFIMLFCITMKRQIKVSTRALRRWEVLSGEPAWIFSVVGVSRSFVQVCSRDRAQPLLIKVANSNLSHSPAIKQTALWGPGGKGPQFCCAVLTGPSSWGLRAQGPPQ
uniref:Protein RER1 n=1 Tax=Lynx canadensis TaxID=61383 RepID=A0A667HRA0_LYNCA